MSVVNLVFKKYIFTVVFLYLFIAVVLCLFIAKHTKYISAFLK